MRIGYLLLAALLLAAGWTTAAMADRPDPHTRPLPVNVNIRAEPSLNAERLATLERGQTVWVHGEPTDEGWVRVSNAQKTIHGWMAAYLLDRPANKATPARRSQSAFTDALFGSDSGSGGAPAPAPAGGSGSLFTQALQSGEIERAQEEKRRRDAEQARLRAEAEERNRREVEEFRRQREWEEAENQRRWQREEEERRYQRELAWADAAAEAEADRLQRWNMIQGIERSFQQQVQQQQQLADLQRAQAEQRRIRQQQQQQQTQQQQAEAERRRQQEAERQRQERELQEQQARTLAQIQQSTQPRPITSSPPPRPVTTPTTNPVPREQRQRGCWSNPTPPNTTCLRSDPRRSGDRFIVTHHNICSERIVARMCNERAGGQPLCGQSGILPGGSHNWDSGRDSTGGYSVQWVGSRNSVEDWACASEIGWRN